MADAFLQPAAHYAASAALTAQTAEVEEDGIVADWFARHQAIAALVRPDHYVYGVASTLKEIDSLAGSFHAACTA